MGVEWSVSGRHRRGCLIIIGYIQVVLDERLQLVANVELFRLLGGQCCPSVRRPPLMSPWWPVGSAHPKSEGPPPAFPGLLLLQNSADDSSSSSPPSPYKPARKRAQARSNTIWVFYLLWYFMYSAGTIELVGSEHFHCLSWSQNPRGKDFKWFLSLFFMMEK